MDNQIHEKLVLLKELKIDTKPIWGKMTPQHMIEHLIASFQIAIGELNVGCFNPPEKLPTLKKYLLSSRPLPKDFVNPIIGADLKPLRFAALSESISVLEEYIKKYYECFDNDPNLVTINPTFGELNKTEWDVFHEKHMTHHFSQFGLIKKESE